MVIKPLLERVCTDSIMSVCMCMCVCEIVLGGNEGHIWDRELALVNQSERGNILSWAPGIGSTRWGINTQICECIHTQMHTLI